MNEKPQDAPANEKPQAPSVDPLVAGQTAQLTELMNNEKHIDELDLGKMMGGGAPKAPEAPKPAAPTAPEAPKPAPAAPMPNVPQPNLVRLKTSERIMILKSGFTIGKSKINADYTLENNSAISRAHCRIIQERGVNYLEDLNSTNGTYVDGIKVDPGDKILLKNGARIRMGDEDFIFYLRKGE